MEKNSEKTLGLLGAVSRISIFTGMSRVLGLCAIFYWRRCWGLGGFRCVFCRFQIA